jgi:PQQ-dependent catabolism-associated CXXCW motif protein
MKPGAPSVQLQNFADELTDFGVAPKTDLEPDFATRTPMTIPGGRVIRTTEVWTQVRDQRMLFVDVLLGARHRTIPGALQLPGAGSASTFVDDEILEKLGTTLAGYTKNDLDAPIVFFCYGAECWESYNAALRAIRLGYRNVYWYRGGLAAWEAAGLPTVEPVLPGRKAQRSRSANRSDPDSR